MTNGPGNKNAELNVTASVLSLQIVFCGTAVQPGPTQEVGQKVVPLLTAVRLPNVGDESRNCKTESKQITNKPCLLRHASKDIPKHLSVSIWRFVNDIIFERSLAVKLPTIWTDGKAKVGIVREEKRKRKKIRRERIRRKKM